MASDSLYQTPNLLNSKNQIGVMSLYLGIQIMKKTLAIQGLILLNELLLVLVM